MPYTDQPERSLAVLEENTQELLEECRAPEAAMPPDCARLAVLTQDSGILNSWKEIAAYMGRGVRTVQRWHDTLQLPVHRIDARNKRSPVFAYREEIDRWMKRRRSVTTNRDWVSTVRRTTKLARALHQQQRALRDRFKHTRQLRVEFMSTDLDAALIMTRLAEEARDDRKRSRNEANARRALDTVLNLYRRSKLTDDERSVLDGKITEVRAALERITPQQQSE